MWAGTHREIGRQIGESCTTQVHRSVENAHLLLANAYEDLQLTWDGAQIQARKYLPFAQERYPQYVDEMIGIAEGAGVPFDDVAVVNAMEAVTMDALHLTKCTSMAVNERRTADGHVLVAHNEDWLPEDEADVYVVHVTPNDEPPFIAMTYGGLLPNIGFNADGIAQCCDTVYPTDIRIGIPRVWFRRAVLAARTPGDAIRCACRRTARQGITTCWRTKVGSYTMSKSLRNVSPSCTARMVMWFIPTSIWIPSCKPSNMSRTSLSVRVCGISAPCGMFWVRNSTP